MTGSSAEWHRAYDRVPSLDTSVFQVSLTKRIPGQKHVWSPEHRSERRASLQSMPAHKSGTVKFSPEMTRNVVPLT